MKQLLRYRDSLVFRLVLAFVLVSVPSVLLASEIATRLVTRAFNEAVENWLRETTNYALSTMGETQDEYEGIMTLLRDRFRGPEIAFSPEELRAMQRIDIESIIVRDASDQVIYSAGPALALDKNVIYPQGGLRWQVLKDGSRTLALSMEAHFSDSALERRTVAFAESFSLEPPGNTLSTSLILRIFVPENGSFTQIYSTSDGTFSVPGHVGEVLLAGASDYFMPDKDWTDDHQAAHLFFQPVRDAEGKIQILFVSGASMSGLDTFISDSTLFFWVLFFGGMLISSSIGYVLAKRIVRPIQSLDIGVRHIASGRLGYEVPVNGGDEIASLALGFNMMSRQLKIMRQEKMLSERRERTRLLGEIALGFAHEIRNPLLVIKTSAEMLHNRLPSNANDTKLLGFVVEEVERINSLISEFLGFAKPGAPIMAEESLSELAEMATALCRAQCDQLKIDCSLFKDTNNDVILCDAKQMQQVFLNLILNAMDAMPHGGRLDLRVYGDDVNVCFDVSDTGQGISPQHLQEIHLPFVSTKEHGLGLGLSKVHAIIEEHGGVITCTSALNEGTTFSVCLKRRDTEPCTPF